MFLAAIKSAQSNILTINGGYRVGERVTRKLLAQLHQIAPFDADHLPRAIKLIETGRQRHPKLPQVVCFDTAFHQTMARLPKPLPLPRRYDGKDIQR